MGLVTNRPLLNKVLALFFICINLGYAQNKDVEVIMRDYHSAQITDVLASTSYPYFFTADASGKVLLHSNETKRVVSTIKEASGFPITDMRLSNDDLMLTVNQKIAFTDGKNDSIIAIEVFTGERLLENQAKFNFIGNQEDAIIIQDTNAEGSLHIIDVYDKTFKKINRYYFSGQITKGVYHIETSKMAVVESDLIRQLKIIVQTGEDYENRTEIAIPKGLKIVDMFYHNNELYVLTHKASSKTISIYNISEDTTFQKSLYEKDTGFLASINVSRTEIKDGFRFVITSQNSFLIRPLVIEQKNGKYSSWIPKTTDGINNYVYLTNEEEHLFFENYNANFGSSMRYNIYDETSKALKSSVPEKEKKFFHGIYLTNSDWMVIGDETIKLANGLQNREFQIKYYEAGTFSNRFNTLDYADYMLVNHKVKDLSSADFQLNKSTGIHPFFGSSKNGANDAFAFYAYDFKKDELTTISTLKTERIDIVDYNHRIKTALITERKYYNGGYNEPNTYALLTDAEEIPLDGKYKFGSFSNNGKYLLLISDNNELSIKDMESGTVLHSETLTDGKYKIFTENDQSFVVANSYWTINMDKCNQISISYSVLEDLKVARQEINCANVIDVANYKDSTYAIIENVGLLLGERLLKFPPSDFPTHVSVDKTGEQLMVSFNSGRIKIYDIATAKPKVEMVHPDKDSHIFLNANGYFFANTNLKDFMYAKKDGKGVALETIEQVYFKPKEILQDIGEPNQDYLQTLDKALALRTNSLSNEGVKVDDSERASAAIKTTKKGDLYLLAIGVSQYQQNEYNLTFADKDALDMSRLYGKLNKEDQDYYNLNFFGDRFYLSGSTIGYTQDIKMYSETYNTVGDIFALNPDGTKWLEYRFNEPSRLWDFESGTVSDVKLPQNTSIGSFRTHKHLFIDPDGKGFYVMDQDDQFYYYDFEKGSFKAINLPPQKDNVIFDSNEIAFIENQKWVYYQMFSYGERAISLTIGQFNAKVTAEKKFNPSIYEEILKDGRRKLDSTDVNFKFKALSGNGSHLLYATYDGELFYKNLEFEEQLPVKLPVNTIHKVDQLTIANDGSGFSIYTPFSRDTKERLVFYNFEENTFETKDLTKSSIGFSVYNNDFKSIEKDKPVAGEFTEFMEKELEAADPFSFNSTQVKYLTNEKATFKTISKELNTLFSSAKPEDQIMVFLAGHGVLDENLNYYFAPHDMDFTEVTKNGIGLKAILKALQESASSNKLLLMDSCHSGNTLDVDSEKVVTTAPNLKSNQRGSKSRSTDPENKFKVSDVISGLFEDFLSQSGVTIISASSGADVAYENESMANGAFTSAYIKLLKDKLLENYSYGGTENYKAPVLIDSEAIDFLLREVIQLTNGKQTPDLRELNKNTILKIW